jgi:hypothetical protein
VLNRESGVMPGAYNALVFTDERGGTGAMLPGKPSDHGVRVIRIESGTRSRVPGFGDGRIAGARASGAVA